MSETYSALIIGAGNIGALYDTPQTDQVLTHAHAFTKHNGFELVGFVDTDEKKAQDAASIWGGSSFAGIEEAFDTRSIDVVCVAVPDEHHYGVLKALSMLSVRVIFAEKPLAKTLEEAKELIKIFDAQKVNVMVNYTRHFMPEFERIKQDIGTGAYGMYLTGTGYYGKGLVHNGSHLIDLLRYFIGEIDSVAYVDSIADFYQDDKSVAAVLTLKNRKPFFLQYADCRKFAMFEMDMFFESKRIRITDLGYKLEVYDVLESNTFKGYRNIVKTAELDAAFGDALYHAVDNIYSFLTDNEALKCNVEDAYKTLESCMRIRESGCSA